MTTYASEGFESGTNGANVSTSNTSSDLISGTAPTFSTDSHAGTLAMRINQTAATASAARFQTGSRTTMIVGLWIKSDGAWPTANCYPSAIRTSSTIKTDWRLPNGIISIRGGGTGSAVTWTAGSALPTNAWCYVEHYVSPTGQRIVAYAADGTVLIDSGAQAWAAATSVDNVVIGSGVAAANSFFKIDQFIAADVSFAPAPPEPPVVYTHFRIASGVLHPMTVSPV